MLLTMTLYKEKVVTGTRTTTAPTIRPISPTFADKGLGIQGGESSVWTKPFEDIGILSTVIASQEDILVDTVSVTTSFKVS